MKGKSRLSARVSDVAVEMIYFNLINKFRVAVKGWQGKNLGACLPRKLWKFGYSYMHSGAIWNVKYQDSILNKIISCGYNDAWFVTLRSKVTTALEETNKKTISNHNMGANQTWSTECICTKLKAIFPNCDQILVTWDPGVKKGGGKFLATILNCGVRERQ